MTPTGELEFNAPEMLKEEKLSTYDEKVDVWGLGVCMYMMLNGGKSPFYNENLAKMIKNIISPNFEYNIPDVIQDNQANDLLGQMLTRNPQ